jgi:hypothetical protein
VAGAQEPDQGITAAHLVHPPLHPPEVRPHVDQREDDAHASLGRFRQDEVEALQPCLIKDAQLRSKDTPTVKTGACPRAP